jgi:hypothetical protein
VKEMAYKHEAGKDFWTWIKIIAGILILAGIFAIFGQSFSSSLQSASDSRISDIGTQSQQPPQAPIQPLAETSVPTATRTPKPITTKAQESTTTAKEIPIDLPMIVSPDINRADLKLNLFYTGDSPLIKGYIDYPSLKEGNTLSIVLLKDDKPVEIYGLQQKKFPFVFLRGSQEDIAEIKSRFSIWIKN